MTELQQQVFAMVFATELRAVLKNAHEFHAESRTRSALDVKAYAWALEQATKATKACSTDVIDKAMA